MFEVVTAQGKITVYRPYNVQTFRGPVAFYEAIGPDGRRFTNSSKVTIRQRLQMVYGKK